MFCTLVGQYALVHTHVVCMHMDRTLTHTHSARVHE